MSEEQKVVVHEHTHRNIQNPPSLDVKISRGMKGGYGWEISYSGYIGQKDDILKIIAEVDEELRGKYPVEPTKEAKEK